MRTLRATWLIARNDFLALLRSPLGWCSLAAFQLVLGLFFFVVFLWDFMANQPALSAARSSFGLTAYVVAPTYKSAALVLLLLTPLLSMNSFAQERRHGTLPLLFSSPVSNSALVFGKYFGLLGFLVLLLALLSVLPLTLRLGGSLDLGLWAACVLACALLATSAAAIGVYVSSLCATPATAAVTCLLVLLVLWTLDTGAAGTHPSEQLLAYLSLTRHTNALMRGVFSSADVIYFLLLAAGALSLAVRRVAALRTRT